MVGFDHEPHRFDSRGLEGNMPIISIVQICVSLYISRSVVGAFSKTIITIRAMIGRNDLHRTHITLKKIKRKEQKNGHDFLWGFFGVTEVAEGKWRFIFHKNEKIKI